MADLLADDTVSQYTDVTTTSGRTRTSTSIDAVRKTGTSLEWLAHNGYGSLLKSTVLVVNHVEPARVGHVAAGEIEQLSARVALTAVLPFDRHVHEGRQISPDRLSGESRRGYLELAAAPAGMVPGRSAECDVRVAASPASCRS